MKLIIHEKQNPNLISVKNMKNGQYCLICCSVQHLAYMHEGKLISLVSQDVWIPEDCEFKVEILKIGTLLEVSS